MWVSLGCVGFHKEEKTLLFTFFTVATGASVGNFGLLKHQLRSFALRRCACMKPSCNDVSNTSDSCLGKCGPAARGSKGRGRGGFYLGGLWWG